MFIALEAGSNNKALAERTNCQETTCCSELSSPGNAKCIVNKTKINTSIVWCGFDYIKTFLPDTKLINPIK